LTHIISVSTGVGQGEEKKDEKEQKPDLTPALSQAEQLRQQDLELLGEHLSSHGSDFDTSRLSSSEAPENTEEEREKMKRKRQREFAALTKKDAE
jgi:hypothetical protein